MHIELTYILYKHTNQVGNGEYHLNAVKRACVVGSKRMSSLDQRVAFGQFRSVLDNNVGFG